MRTDGRSYRQQVAERPLALQRGRRENQTVYLYIRPGPGRKINLRREVFNLHAALLEETPSRWGRWRGRE